MLDIVKRACERAGGVNALAAKLGIKRQAFYQWPRVPAERVISIERASGIPRHELRPDIYPPPETEAAA